MMDLFWHITSLVSGLGVPLLIALLRSYQTLRDRVIKTETILDDRVKKVDSMSERQITADLRVASHEQTLLQLKEITGMLAAQYSAVALKLEALTRIDENVKNLSEVVKLLVTKEETKYLESRLRTVEEKLDSNRRIFETARAKLE